MLQKYGTVITLLISLISVFKVLLPLRTCKLFLWWWCGGKYVGTYGALHPYVIEEFLL